MTTEAQEVTTVDELLLEEDLLKDLDPQGSTLRGDAR